MTASPPEYEEIDLRRDAPFSAGPESGETLASPGEASDPLPGQSQPPAINLVVLARKVYALLKKELRLEIERQGRSEVW